MRRALVVGIDHYDGPGRLTGCVNDAKAIAALLDRHSDGDPNHDVKLLASDGRTKVTRTRLNAALDELLPMRRETVESIIFYFAGHGVQSPGGGQLLTQSDTVAMSEVMARANRSLAKEVVIILDCCFGGDVGNATGGPAANEILAMLDEGVTVLAASRSDEEARETIGHGTFSSLLIDGLEGAAADLRGEVTACGLYHFASRALGAFDQRPVMKSHVLVPAVLRSCEPWVQPVMLRRLPAVFAHESATPHPAPEDDLGDDGQMAGVPSEGMEVYRYLRQLRGARLLEIDAGVDLYYAVRDGHEVRLNDRGRYFWRLAKKGRV